MNDRRRHLIHYVEMSKLCRYRMNEANIELKSDFKIFLANRGNRTWIDEKNRTWKYYLTRRSINSVRNKMHPFVTNYDPGTETGLVDIYVYYLICDYLAKQLQIVKIEEHARIILEYIENREERREIWQNLEKIGNIFLTLINLFVDHTDIIICYNRLNNKNVDNDTTAPTTLVVSNANVDVHNPKINLISNHESDDEYFFDENFSPRDSTTPESFEFRFIDNMDEFTTRPENDSFIATGFSIKSFANTLDTLNFPHADSYKHDRHVVTLVVMITEETSKTFEEIFHVSQTRRDASYVFPYPNILYQKLNRALVSSGCNFLVADIVYKNDRGEGLMTIIFDDIKSKPYKGRVLDIIIEITFGKK